VWLNKAWDGVWLLPFIDAASELKSINIDGKVVLRVRLGLYKIRCSCWQYFHA